MREINGKRDLVMFRCIRVFLTPGCLTLPIFPSLHGEKTNVGAGSRVKITKGHGLNNAHLQPSRDAAHPKRGPFTHKKKDSGFLPIEYGKRHKDFRKEKSGII